MLTDPVVMTTSEIVSFVGFEVTLVFASVVESLSMEVVLCSLGEVVTVGLVVLEILSSIEGSVGVGVFTDEKASSGFGVDWIGVIVMS